MRPAIGVEVYNTPFPLKLPTGWEGSQLLTEFGLTRVTSVTSHDFTLRGTLLNKSQAQRFKGLSSGLELVHQLELVC